MALQVDCGLASLPRNLNVLSHIRLLDLRENPGLLRYNGTALTYAGLAGLRSMQSCRQLDLRWHRRRGTDTEVATTLR